METIVELSLLDNFVGLPMPGANVGHLPHMDVGDGGLRIDVNVLLSGGRHERSHDFSWHERKRLGLHWTAEMCAIEPSAGVFLLASE